MAYMIPSDVSQQALPGAHAPELDTLSRLEKALPNHYTVFHRVHWSREYEDWSHFGKVDFVVLNRAAETTFIDQINQGLSSRVEAQKLEVAHIMSHRTNKIRSYQDQEETKVSNRSKLDATVLEDYRNRLVNLGVPDSVINCFDENDFGIGNPAKAAHGRKAYRKIGLIAAAGSINYRDIDPFVAARILMWSLGREVFGTETVLSSTSPTPTDPPRLIPPSVLHAILDAWEASHDLPDGFPQLIDRLRNEVPRQTS